MSIHTSQKDHITIAQAVEKELIHFSTLGTVITEIPERFCSVNPQLLKYIRNRDCWNGTALGRYAIDLKKSQLYYSYLVCSSFSCFKLCLLLRHF